MTPDKAHVATWIASQVGKPSDKTFLSAAASQKLIPVNSNLQQQQLQQQQQQLPAATTAVASATCDPAAAGSSFREHSIHLPPGGEDADEFQMPLMQYAAAQPQQQQQVPQAAEQRRTGTPQPLAGAGAGVVCSPQRQAFDPRDQAVSVQSGRAHRSHRHKHHQSKSGASPMPVQQMQMQMQMQMQPMQLPPNAALALAPAMSLAPPAASGFNAQQQAYGWPPAGVVTLPQAQAALASVQSGAFTAPLVQQSVTSYSGIQQQQQQQPQQQPLAPAANATPPQQSSAQPSAVLPLYPTQASEVPQSSAGAGPPAAAVEVGGAAAAASSHGCSSSNSSVDALAQQFRHTASLGAASKDSSNKSKSSI